MMRFSLVWSQTDLDDPAMVAMMSSSSFQFEEEDVYLPGSLVDGPNLELADFPASQSRHSRLLRVMVTVVHEGGSEAEEEVSIEGTEQVSRIADRVQSTTVQKLVQGVSRERISVTDDGKASRPSETLQVSEIAHQLRNRSSHRTVHVTAFP